MQSEQRIRKKKLFESSNVEKVFSSSRQAHQMIEGLALSNTVASYESSAT